MLLDPRFRRIAILLPNLCGGGAERVNLNLARELLRMGHSVDFVLLERKGELLPDVPAGARVVALDRSIRTSARAIATYLRREQPSVLYAHVFPLTWMAAVARAMSGTRVPLVMVEHNDFRESLRAHPRPRVAMQTIARYIYPLADRLVCVSQGAANSLAAMTGIERATIDVIPNPVYLPSPAGAPIAQDLARWWEQAPVRLLAVGALTAQKDYDTMLAAVAALPDTLDARLVVLGEGPERARLEREIDRRGLTDRVRLGGFQPDREAWYARASLHLLSSRFEGLPTVLIEALVAGVPSVSTDCPSGPREILEDGRLGTLVPVGAPEAMAGAIVAALGTEPDRDALRARAKDFNPPAAARRYLSLINREPAFA